MKWLLALLLAGSAHAGVDYKLALDNSLAPIVDTNARGNSSNNGTLTYVSSTPKPLQGTYHARISGGRITLPTSTFWGITTTSTGAFGISFFNPENQINTTDGALISAKLNGKDFMIYHQWGAGNRNLLVRFPTSGGNADSTTTAITWSPGVWYSLWVNFKTTGFELYMYDHSADKTTRLLNVTNTPDLTSCTGVWAAAYTDACCVTNKSFDNIWISDSNHTTYPFAGSTNWEPGVNAWSLVNYGDSSITGYGCTPDTATYGYIQSYRPYLEYLLSQNLNSYQFSSTGSKYDAPTISTITLASAMTEGSTGLTSANAISQYATDEAKYFKQGSTGNGVIYILGGFHGDVAGAVSAASVMGSVTTLAATIMTDHPQAKILVCANYIIGSGGTTQNTGMLNAANAMIAAYGADQARYFDLTLHIGLAQTCDDSTHLQKTAYETYATALYNDLVTWVTPVGSQTPNGLGPWQGGLRIGKGR